MQKDADHGDHSVSTIWVILIRVDRDHRLLQVVNRVDFRAGKKMAVLATRLRVIPWDRKATDWGA